MRVHAARRIPLSEHDGCERTRAPVMRADIHDGPEHNTLQSEAGYIDARPQSARLTKPVGRAAGPSIRVKSGISKPDKRVAKGSRAEYLSQIWRSIMRPWVGVSPTRGSLPKRNVRQHQQVACFCGVSKKPATQSAPTAIAGASYMARRSRAFCEHGCGVCGRLLLNAP